MPTPGANGEENPPAARTTLPHPRRRKQRATILLVEDEAALRTVAQRALEREGYTVLAAEDGDEALAVAAGFAGRIDLLVTDMILPDLRGRELAARLLSNRAELRILYMTGYTDDDVFRRDFPGESAFVLEKPFNLGQLADAVSLALFDDGSDSDRSAEI